MSASAQLAWVLLWLVLVTVLVAALVVLALSRWGRSKPVRICAVLSLLMHVLLAGYAATIQILTPPPGPPGRGGIDVALIDDFGPEGVDASSSPDPEPWERFSSGSATPAPAADLPKAEAALLAPPPAAELPTPPSLLAAALPAPVPPVAVPPPLELPQSKLPLSATDIARIPALLDPPAPQKQESKPTGPATDGPDRVADETPLDQVATIGPPKESKTETANSIPELPPLPPALADSASVEAAPSTATLLGQLAPLPPVAADLATTVPTRPETSVTGSRVSKGASDGAGNTAGTTTVPEPYRARVEGDRAAGATRRGGSPEAEAAVQAGLRWLAAAQSDDGRWEAALYGAGRETRIGGTDRQGAGATADTGITGLALLAFLGSGNTHMRGEYRDNVRRGLEFLLSVQRTNGSLAGNARMYEAMYCHGMAAFAISEAAAMTHDERLKPAVSRAVTFIVASQHPATGGWRYQPGDPGDTSQLGWQIMALRSAELAGTPIPDRTRDGIQRFLTSVASGQHGGLASYRAGEKVSRTMTAEALAARQFMRISQPEASREAADYIVQEVPGAAEVNLYYWYYATLSMYQLQDEHWERWNEALQRSLLASQRHEGDQAGSWDNDVVWGTYGGRVYTTALSTLCLEVYYRYLPLYAARGGKRSPVR